MEGQVDGGMQGLKAREKDRWKKLRMDRRTGGRKGRQKDKRTNRRTDGHIVRQADGRTDRQTG